MSSPNSAQQLLYVSDVADAVVNVYDVPGYTLAGRIKGIEQPEGIATDPKGNLYVTDLLGNKVWIFKSGKTKPFLTITDRGPDAVAVAPNGDVLVGDIDGGINIYPPGQTTAQARLTNSAATDVDCIAVDANENVFAGGSNSAYIGSVVEYKKMKGSGTNLGLTGLQVPGSVLLDKTGDLVVSDYETSLISIFPPGKTAPSSTISVPSPNGSSFNHSRTKLYVPESTSGQVAFLRYPSGMHAGALQISSSFIVGTAFYPPARP